MTAYIAPGLQKPEEIIAEEFGCSVDEITTRSREEQYVEPRRIIMWYYKKHKGYSLARAGRIVKRDHATALNAYRKVEGFIEVDKQYKRMLAEIMRKLELLESNKNMV